MKIPRLTLRAAAVIAAVVSGTTGLAAQGVTTGAMSGTVVSEQGQGLGQAQVQVVNRNTGARSGTTTRADGAFYVQGLEVGGPYTVSVRHIGYAPKDTAGIFVSLGQNLRLDLKLSTRPAQIEAVTIVATTTGSVISPSHKGIETTISDSTIARMPTLNRNFTDFVKLTPSVTTSGPGNSGGGQNNRFNAIQIDGAVASDLFGLGATGQPGAQANGKQISLEAVKEYQVLLAPYDVRQGSFTGFLVNAVTKSGSNEFHGSGTYATRNEKLERDRDFLRASPFTQSQYGFWIGGPIVRDKVFFSVAPEFQSQNAPAAGPYIGAGSPTPSPVIQASVDSLVNILKTQYGFSDPGNAGPIKNENPLANMFARLDFVNLPGNSRLVTRYNYVKAQQDILSRSGTRLNLSNNGYNFSSTTNSEAAQLYSNFSNGNSNELLLGFTTLRDNRVVPITSPFVVISRAQGTTGTGQISAGTENSSQGNQLDQDILELTDNFTIPYKNHRFTIGTKNEFLKVRNLFGQNSYGNFTFGTLDSLRANTPSSATVGVKLDNTDGAARFHARTLSGYAEDEWQASRNVSLTFGIRLDVPGFTDSPGLNQNILNALKINTTQVPKNVMQWSPRFGFNWDVTGDQTNQLRGGSGVFMGRPAYVWVSNAFGNSGVNGFGNLICSTMATSPTMQQAGSAPATTCRNSTAVPSITINTVDPNMKFPEVWRSSLGFDRRLPWNTIATVEGMYTRAIYQFYYQNIGLVDNPIGTDRNGRALYGDISTGNNILAQFKPGVSSVFNIGNTKHAHDYAYNVTGQLQKRFTNRFEGLFAYTFQHSYSVWDVTSSVAQSNWQFGRSYAGRQEAEELRPSKFDAPHRLLVSGTYTLPTKTDVSVSFTGESGVPFEYVYGTDMNGDNFSSNDLIYVPKDAHDLNEIRFSQLGTGATGLTPAAQADSLEAYIKARPCLNSQRGAIMLRNSCRTPWTKHMDLSARQSLRTLGAQHFILQLDVFNFLNLVNKNWGAQDLGSSNSPLLLTRTGFTGGTKLATGVAGGGAQSVFTFSPNNFATQFNTRNASSNYALQLQLKYTF
ncbi:MAG: carboxypeptidase regulatory-like domain-containing protein [bacterium]